MTDWDDGTVNHAASPEWNAGVGQSDRSDLSPEECLSDHDLPALAADVAKQSWWWVKRPDWRCECGDLNRWYESGCYRCGAGRPDDDE